jgi:hypothetical protein
MNLAELRKSTVVNLTPHNIVFREPHEEVQVFPPSGDVARLSTIVTPIGDLLNSIEYGKVEGLPEPKKGTIYLVSNMVLSHLRDRLDVLSPDTANHVVRAKDGHIVAVTKFLCCPRTTFTFKKGGRNVARLFLHEGKLLGREILDVRGSYTVSAGDIIEKRKRTGRSGKNDQRYWYIVINEGQEKIIGYYQDSKLKMKVIKYLRNEIGAEDFLQQGPVQIITDGGH